VMHIHRAVMTSIRVYMTHIYAQRSDEYTCIYDAYAQRSDEYTCVYDAYAQRSDEYNIQCKETCNVQCNDEYMVYMARTHSAVTK
jgi:hypothetical protein